MEHYGRPPLRSGQHRGSGSSLVFRPRHRESVLVSSVCLRSQCAIVYLVDNRTFACHTFSEHRQIDNWFLTPCQKKRKKKKKEPGLKGGKKEKKREREREKKRQTAACVCAGACAREI